jgi:hypothetical protein
LTDALAGESEYEVTGPPDKFEEASADVFLAGAPSKTRRVRFRAYEIETESSGFPTYVALAHYTFPGNELPSICCEWFTRLFVLSRQPTRWTADHTDWSLTERAKAVTSFRLVDLDGDGREDVVVEAEQTAASHRGLSMTIFGVAGSRLTKLAEVETRSSNDWSHVQFSRELDLVKTRAAAGKTIFFRSAVYGTEEKQFPAPRMEEEAVTPSPKSLH